MEMPIARLNEARDQVLKATWKAWKEEAEVGKTLGIERTFTRIYWTNVRGQRRPMRIVDNGQGNLPSKVAEHEED